MGGEQFDKIHRLLARTQFRRVGRHGRRLVGQLVCVDLLQLQRGEARLGLTVPTKYGKAHMRNRFKRVVREAFRRNRAQFPVGTWLNVRPRTRAQSAAAEEVERELLALIAEAAGSG